MITFGIVINCLSTESYLKYQIRRHDDLYDGDNNLALHEIKVYCEKSLYIFENYLHKACHFDKHIFFLSEKYNIAKHGTCSISIF